MQSLARYIQNRTGEYRLREPTRDAVITEFAIEGEKSVVRKLIDVEPILKDCVFFRLINETNGGYSQKRNFRHIGRMPFHAHLQITRAAAGDQKLEDRYARRWFKAHERFCTVDHNTI